MLSMKTGDRVVCIDARTPTLGVVQEGRIYIVEATCPNWEHEPGQWVEVNGEWLLSERFAPARDAVVSPTTDTLRRLILELGPHLDAIEAGEDRWERLDSIIGTMIYIVDGRPGTADCCDAGHGATLTMRDHTARIPADLAEGEGQVFVFGEVEEPGLMIKPGDTVTIRVVPELKVGDEIDIAGTKINYSQLPRDPVGTHTRGDRLRMTREEVDLIEELIKAVIAEHSPNADCGDVLHTIRIKDTLIEPAREEVGSNVQL